MRARAHGPPHLGCQRGHALDDVVNSGRDWHARRLIDDYKVVAVGDDALLHQRSAAAQVMTGCGRACQDKKE